MRIAVTGAAGSLGRAVVVGALEQGHTAVALDRVGREDPQEVEGVETHTVELTDFAAVRSAVADCDALVHLAAYISPHAAPEPEVFDNNVVSSYHCFAAAAAAGITRVCYASSVNALGGVYSTQPRFDYFPLDEHHPSYAEDAYSLSKWVGEQQAAAFVRRDPQLRVACLRFHALRDRAEMAARFGDDPARMRRDLWGYTPMDLAAQTCLRSLTADLDGCETFYVVAADTYVDADSEELRRRFHPDVPVRGDLSGRRSFYDSSRAAVRFG